jgi:hypothetical protein
MLRRGLRQASALTLPFYIISWTKLCSWNEKASWLMNDVINFKPGRAITGNFLRSVRRNHSDTTCCSEYTSMQTNMAVMFRIL